MKYLLDTNICIRYLNQRSEAIINRLNQTTETEIVLCSVVKAELYLGAMKSQTPQRTMEKQQFFVKRFRSLPFDDQAALFYAQIRASLEQSGTPIGGNDMMIAAIALQHNLILVTNNTREFSRINDLTIEDWEQA